MFTSSYKSVAAAIISSVKDVPISFSTVLFGEVGLSGEIRKVNQAELRIKEATKLGFDNIVLPSKQKIMLEKNISHNNLTLLSDLVDLITKNIQVDLMEFFETLEDDDDVQNIYSNMRLKIN